MRSKKCSFYDWRRRIGREKEHLWGLKLVHRGNCIWTIRGNSSSHLEMQPVCGSEPVQARLWKELRLPSSERSSKENQDPSCKKGQIHSDWSVILGWRIFSANCDWVVEVYEGRGKQSKGQHHGIGRRWILHSQILDRKSHTKAKYNHCGKIKFIMHRRDSLVIWGLAICQITGINRHKRWCVPLCSPRRPQEIVIRDRSRH
jgi:hypothetical protein